MTAPRPGRRDTLEVLALYSPRSVPNEAAVFAREVVSRCHPESPARAKALLFATSKLAAYALSVGLALDEEVCLHPGVLERFVKTGLPGVAPATRRTLRTNLNAVERALHGGSPRPFAYPREQGKAPYSEAEIASFLANADAQASLARRMRANALICLGAGAGLLGQELRGLRGIDVVSRHGGLVVSVGGRRARLVPVLPAYHERLEAASVFAKERYLLGGNDPGRSNVTTRLVASLSGGTDLPRLETNRLRATWLAACAGRIGLAAFMAAAGVRCSQRLEDVVSHLAPPSEADLVALLGRRS